MSAASQRGVDLRLNDDEVAFYDASRIPVVYYRSAFATLPPASFRPRRD
jgi:hypothetical protein